MEDGRAARAWRAMREIAEGAEPDFERLALIRGCSVARVPARAAETQKKDDEELAAALALVDATHRGTRLGARRQHGRRGG